MSFYNDNFNDASGTLLVNHTSDSGATYAPHPAFSPVPSAKEIPTGIRMRGNAATPNVFNISQAAPGPDHSMTCKVYIASTGNVTETGVICRVTPTGSGNWYSLTINNGSVHLYKNLSQTYTQLGSNVTLGETAGIGYLLTLACLGSIITGMVTRDSDGFYLTSAGTWQAAPTNVFSFVDSSVPPTSNVGVWISSAADSDTTGYQMASASGSAVPALAPSPWQVLDVKAGFGAAGDITGSITDAAISGVDLTTGTGQFRSTHVGKTVSLNNGTSGPPQFNAALIAPPSAPAVCSCCCGTLPATTYYVRVSYVTNLGETVASPETTASLGADNVLYVVAPATVFSAVGWNVYVSAQLPPPTFPGTVFTGASNTGGVLVGGATYYYKVTAIDTVGETAASAEVSYPVPSGTNTNQVTLNWNAVAGAIAYKIYRSTSSTGEAFIAQIPATNTFYADSGAVTPAGSPPATNTTGSGAEIKQNSSLLSLSSAWQEPTTGLVGGPGCLVTTIAKYVGQNQVKLAASWPFTGQSTSLTATWGTDDTTAFQNMLNAATTNAYGTGRSIMYVPAGQYLITRPLKVGNPGSGTPPGVVGLVMYGAGRGDPEFNLHNFQGLASRSVIVGAVAANQPIIQITGGLQIAIRDLELFGAGKVLASGQLTAPAMGIQLMCPNGSYPTSVFLFENMSIITVGTGLLADYINPQSSCADVTCQMVTVGYCFNFAMRVLNVQGVDYYLRSFYVAGLTGAGFNPNFVAVQFDQGGMLEWQGGDVVGIATVLRINATAGGKANATYKLEGLRLEQNTDQNSRPLKRIIVDTYNNPGNTQGVHGIYQPNTIEVSNVNETDEGNDTSTPPNPLFYLGPGTNLTVRSSTLYRAPLAIMSSGVQGSAPIPGDCSLLLDNVSYPNLIPFAAAITSDAGSFWRSRNCRTNENNVNATPRFDESTWLGDGVVAPFRAACFGLLDSNGNALCRGYFRPGNRQSKYIANEFPYAQLVYGTCTGVFRNNPSASPPVIPAVQEDQYPAWFDGNSYVTFLNGSYATLFDLFSGASTIIAWVRFPSSSLGRANGNPIYSNLDSTAKTGAMLTINSSNDVMFQVGDGTSIGSVTMGTNILADTWYLIAAVKDGGTLLKVYMFWPFNEWDTTAAWHGYASSGKPRCIGQDNSVTPTQNVIGYIESLAIFAGALSQTQLQNLYNIGVNGG